MGDRAGSIPVIRIDTKSVITTFIVDNALFCFIRKYILWNKNAPRDAHSLKVKNARRSESASRHFVLAFSSNKSYNRYNIEAY